MDTDGAASHSAGLSAGGRLKAGNRSSARRQTQFRLAALSASVLFAFAQTAQANPTGANVVNGQASFATTGNTLTVTNTPGTIINWQGFSIGSNEITRFAQQSASSAVLNRVISNDPSNIMGTLQSNGRVFLINPNGILFGAGAVVDVAGLVASTLNLSDADFLAGNSHYTQVPGAANISNAGSITARGDGREGGQIYLIAPNVENTGVITAPNGEILLAAGYSVDLVSTDEPNLRVNITAPAGDATNIGRLIASSGSLGLFGTVVSNGGIVSADSAVMQGGKIVFKASQLARAGGKVSATGTTGGNIEVLGNEVQVAAGASLDASGASGGGTVLVGGDAHGANPSVMNAKSTYVDAAATIKADAVQNGNGGKVVVWADNATQFSGNISARGGAVSGNGGWVEVSGKQWLGYAGLVDTTAPYGLTGTLLLDPTDITISGAASTGTMAFNGVTFTYTDVTTTPTNLNVTTLQTQLGLSNVTVSSASPLSGTGNITVQESIAWNSANSLTLNAAGSGAITVNPVNLSNGGLLTIANAGTGGLSMVTAGGSITVGAVGTPGGNISLAGGAFTANAGGAASAININSAINAGAGAINLTAGGTVAEGPGGTLTTTGLLTTKSAGGTTLNNANAVGSFNAINTTSGNIALTNNAVLNVTGINNTAAAGSVTVSNGTALGITGAIAAAGGGAISLTATGAAITETGTGLISTTGLLTTNSYSGTALNGANSVGSLSATNIMINDFSFSNSTTAAYFYINGISNVGGNITVNNAGSVMGITGTISGSASINLTNTGASGGIQEFGGKILTTGMLTTNNGSASGTNLNNGGTNMIGTFKATDAGLVFLQNGTALNLAGISAGGGVLISTISGGITVSGPVTASTSTVSLQGFGITNISTITGGGGVTLTAGYSGFAPVGTLTNTTGTITNGGGASTGTINLNADIMVLAGGTITAGAGAVTINNVTLTDAIDLGSTTDVANLTLELSNAELGTISTTGLLSIGNASNSGAITVSAPLNLTYNIALANGAGGIAINGAITATGKNLTFDTAGAATQTATITAAGLELLNGSFTLNAANSIATVAGNAGSISLTDSSALSVGTVNTAGLTSTGAVLLTSGGDISQTASISTTATGNAIVLDAAGNFINKAGAAALSAPNGRWLVYSTDPALDTFGGLMSGNLALWGKTSINYAPGSVVEAGNRYLFSLVPALSVSADLVKIYGTDLTLAPPPATINGLIDAAAYGNVFTQDAVTGTASLTSTGFAATAAISVNPYPVIVAAGTLLAPAGYGVTTYITGSVYVLAPTVVDEIVEISNQRPRKAADVLALETPPADGGNTQPIPMCN